MLDTLTKRDGRAKTSAALCWRLLTRFSRSARRGDRARPGRQPVKDLDPDEVFTAGLGGSGAINLDITNYGFDIFISLADGQLTQTRTTGDEFLVMMGNLLGDNAASPRRRRRASSSKSTELAALPAWDRVRPSGTLSSDSWSPSCRANGGPPRARGASRAVSEPLVRVTERVRRRELTRCASYVSSATSAATVGRRRSASPVGRVSGRAGRRGERRRAPPTRKPTICSRRSRSSRRSTRAIWNKTFQIPVPSTPGNVCGVSSKFSGPGWIPGRAASRALPRRKTPPTSIRCRWRSRNRERPLISTASARPKEIRRTIC